MRKVKICTLVMLCILTIGLCGILVYGMSGYDIYVNGYNNGVSPQLVMEKKVSLDGIDSIFVQYDQNNNDIYLYESEDAFLSIKEYYEFELEEEELSTVTVTGSNLEIRGKRRNGKNQVRVGVYGIRSAYGYTEIGLPSSYKGQLMLATASGDIKSQIDIILENDFKATTSSGDVKISNITAQNVSLHSSSGEIEIEKIHTASDGFVGEINIKTNSGDIHVMELTGNTEIDSSSGNVYVKQVTGETDIETNSGNINSDSILGNTKLGTTSGDITMKYIDGTAAAKTSSGNVQIHEGSGERTVNTTSGEILLADVDSAWEVESSSGNVCIKAQKGSGSIHTTSGDIDLRLEQLVGNLDINSSSGWVKINLSADNAFAFKADTTSGDIQTYFDKDLSFSKKGNSAHGTYGNNQDGRSIVVKTTSGDVQVTD